MKTTTIKIATTFTAAISAATKIAKVISAAASSRLRWRSVVGGFNPGVVGQPYASLVERLAMRHAHPAMATMCRPQSDACRGSRSSSSIVSRRSAVV
ncbi:hypothetical protein Pla108_08400 [Botrimarina colliarenosi]|uniref:Uncharacterized protein n=1 Tax=Botrimarina colliarenosi TaxID=2528001 RepID=A0A5C6AK76_9BACT|nr:hypothetical protein [Botrimarina colliarenosi]TWT99897.1 hypothetical protein Pla108_08400 [Botrimarina colliarenosi]